MELWVSFSLLSWVPLHLLFIIKITIIFHYYFVLSSNYSTNASGAQQIPEKNTEHET